MRKIVYVPKNNYNYINKLHELRTVSDSTTE